MPYQPRVLVSQIIPETVSDVWEWVRDFDSIDEWHPVIENCRIEGGHPPGQIGSVRAFEAGERTVRERLVAHSDEDRFYQYTMLGEDDPDNYLSEFRVLPITETDETLAKWFAHFDVEDGALEEEKEHLTKVFVGGLNNLRDEFS